MDMCFRVLVAGSVSNGPTWSVTCHVLPMVKHVQGLVMCRNPYRFSLHLSQFIPRWQPAVGAADHAPIKTLHFRRRVDRCAKPYAKPSCLGPSWIMIHNQNHQNSLDIWWDDLGNLSDQQPEMSCLLQSWGPEWLEYLYRSMHILPSSPRPKCWSLV